MAGKSRIAKLSDAVYTCLVTLKGGSWKEEKPRVLIKYQEALRWNSSVHPMQRNDELDPLLFSLNVRGPHLERKYPAFLEYLTYLSEQLATVELRETGRTISLHV